MTETYILAVVLAASLQVVFAAECLVGKSENITEEDQPSSELGLFVLPEKVPCNGRIVSCDVCGFFMIEENSISQFLDFVAVLSPFGDNFTIYLERINVKRKNFKAHYTCFRWKSRNPFNVKEGDKIGVATLSKCKENVCPFLPVVNNTESADIILYRASIVETNVSLNSFQIRTDTTIHCRAHINFADKSLDTPGVWIGIGLFLPVLFIVISIGFVLLFCKLRSKWESRATRVSDIAYGVLNTVDGGQDAVDRVEIPLQENTAYIRYNPPSQTAAASDPPRAQLQESGDEDMYEYIQ